MIYSEKEKRTVPMVEHSRPLYYTLLTSYRSALLSRESYMCGLYTSSMYFREESPTRNFSSRRLVFPRKQSGRNTGFFFPLPRLSVILTCKNSPANLTPRGKMEQNPMESDARRKFLSIRIARLMRRLLAHVSRGFIDISPGTSLAPRHLGRYRRDSEIRRRSYI